MYDKITSLGFLISKILFNAFIQFKLSEIDLEIRGEGKVTGTSQSGQSDLKIADLRYDYELLLESKNIFDKIESEDIKKLLFEEAQILFPNYFKASGTT